MTRLIHHCRSLIAAGYFTFRFSWLVLLVFATRNGNAQEGRQPRSDSLVLIYKSVDSIKLGMHVHYPANYERVRSYPAIIFFFGGGWVNGSIYQFARQAQYFASRGMISVLADYRTSSKYKTTPFDAVSDAKSAIRYLRAHADVLGIDSARIVAAGGSAGGHLAAAADLTLLDEPGEDSTIGSRPNALVLFNPVFDNGPGGYGYDRIGERFPLISPMHNIRKNAAPAIAFFGTEDQLVPVATAELYRKKMEEAGNRFDLFLYPGQKHAFFNRGSYVAETLERADIFLQSLGYLEGDPSVRSSGR